MRGVIVSGGNRRCVGIDAAHPRKRVLIADDDADVCVLLRAALASLAEVTTVPDAESALTLLGCDQPYDAIISDFMLPGMSGLQFVERVRRERPGVGVLMISGHGRSVADRARAAGVNQFLEKPFTLAELRGAVAALLRPHSTRVA